MSRTPCNAVADHQGATDPWLKTPDLRDVTWPKSGGPKVTQVWSGSGSDTVPADQPLKDPCQCLLLRYQLGSPGEQTLTFRVL